MNWVNTAKYTGGQTYPGDALDEDTFYSYLQEFLFTVAPQFMDVLKFKTPIDIWEEERKE